MRCSTIQLPSDSSSATMNTSSLPLPDVLTHENVAPVRPKATNPLSPWKPQGLPFKSGWVSTCVKIWLAAGDTVQNRSSFSPYSLMDQLRFSSSVAAHKLSVPAACFEALRRGPGTYAESRPCRSWRSSGLEPSGHSAPRVVQSLKDECKRLSTPAEPHGSKVQRVRCLRLVPFSTPLTKVDNSSGNRGP
jgi:hypothetical protein